MTHNNKQLKRATELAQAGLAVLPIHTIENGICSCSRKDCRSPGKHPATDHGVKDATTDLETISGWFTDLPGANIGVATGAPSGLLVLDIDPRNGGFDTLKAAEAELGQLPRTSTVATGGGGKHLYFQLPKGKIKKDNHGQLIGDGVDVMTDGGYVVAPKSRHVSGNSYSWEEGLSLAEQPPAKLPKAWKERLRHGGQASFPAAAAGKIAEGHRNETITSMVGKLVYSGLDPSLILPAAMAFNTRNCAPPLPDDEVGKIVESVSRYGNNGGVRNIDPAEEVLKATLNQYYAGGENLRLGSGQELWSYDGKKWSLCPSNDVAGNVLNTINALPSVSGRKNSLVRQAMDLLKPHLASKAKIDLTRPLPPVINCRNGELWFGANGSIKLKPHDPKSMLRHCIDIDYNPKA